MITPAQQRILNLPNIQELIKDLDCEVIPSFEYKFNKAASSRIDQWLSDFITATPLTRKPISDSGIQPPAEIVAYNASNEAIEKYLIGIYGPKPWKYPLEFAPF